MRIWMNNLELDNIHIRQCMEEARESCVCIGERLLGELVFSFATVTVAVPRMNVASTPFDLQMVRYSSQRQSIQSDLSTAMKGQCVFDAASVFGKTQLSENGLEGNHRCRVLEFL